MAVEDQVRDFYDKKGWKLDETGTGSNYNDAQLWEDLRPCAADYVAACRRKILDHLPRNGNRLLDAASGPIQYPEYLEYSESFAKRVCVDISQTALNEARKKLGDRGEYVCASLLELPFADNDFDAAVSLHTIYHIEKEEQEKAVRQLLRVVKPGAKVVIIYANPDRFTARVKRLVKPRAAADSGPIYYFAHPLSWWSRFSDRAHIQIVPWRSLNANESRRLIPNGGIGAGFFRAVLSFEKRFPKAATWLGCYPMIVLTKS